MTNVKSKGFGTKAELDAHLDELENEELVNEPLDIEEEGELLSMRNEIAALRAQFEDVRSQAVARIRRQENSSTTEYEIP